MASTRRQTASGLCVQRQSAERESPQTQSVNKRVLSVCLVLSAFWLPTRQDSFGQGLQPVGIWWLKASHKRPQVSVPLTDSEQVQPVDFKSRRHFNVRRTF